MSNSPFAAPQQPAGLEGDRLHSLPLVSGLTHRPTWPFGCCWLRNPPQQGIARAELCIQLSLWPWSCHGGGWGVLKALAAAVGISSLLERVPEAKKGDAGFSSHFLCPENDCGREEATPALAGEAVLGLPAAPSLQLQPGL